VGYKNNLILQNYRSYNGESIKGHVEVSRVDKMQKNLTVNGAYVEDGLIGMKKLPFGCIVWLTSMLGMLAVTASVSKAQDIPKGQTQRSLPNTRVTIEVTGGDKDSPIENASVYLKYVEERKIAKNKQFELNVKTNREGIAHVPDAPLGRVLIQIVAEGWKTFGRWYDITGTKEPIKIHLDRPPKWY
jgi:hypothetical protein